MSSTAEAASRTLHVALAGNPNSGKTSVFNALTGLRHRVGNYPGVTVERIEGTSVLPDGSRAVVTDLPGCYSIFARSEDERIARDVLLGLLPGAARPDVACVVVDATNLERNLYFATQLLETGLRVCVALNMVDLAERRGVPVDPAHLAEDLGVPVVPVVGRTGQGIAELKKALLEARPAPRKWRMTEVGEKALEVVRDVVCRSGIVPERACEGEALRLLTHARDDDPFLLRGGGALRDALAAGRAKLEEAGIDRVSVEAECRYAHCNDVARRARRRSTSPGPSQSEKADRYLTHKVLGPVIYLAVMWVIFDSVYSWAQPFMEWIETATAWVGGETAALLGPGMLTDLLVDGVIAGVGNILVFLPQICLLFLFLTLLEDIGYLARAAFISDRVMRSVGLHGKAFIPLMSSFACAIPGIMAARTLEHRRDRMVTILVAPLMSCSARLPVYALMIGAFIPSRDLLRVGGVEFLNLQGLTLFGMYTFSVCAALTAAWVLRKTFFRGEPSTFLLELPSYKMPAPRYVARSVLDRAWVFVKQAGTVILAISVVLWALAYFPRSEAVEQEAERRIEKGEPRAEVERWAGAAQIEQSYAGTLGKAIEPALEPLGFDWKIGIGVVASFAAREVLVSTLGIVYSVGDSDETSVILRDKLRHARRPDGSPAFTWLTALSLMVFFVLACQCMSTVAVVKRETNSWRWPLFMFGYMTVLAYVGSWIVYQGGLALGWA